MTTDVLGAPYTAETITLPDDGEGPVVATLVHRPADLVEGRDPAGRRPAVLHVHGFADYFFQTGFAEWWTARGHDFYALDLRKYGRSLLPHQTANYITDLAEYQPDLEEAWARITGRDGHRQVVVTAHSTGGLTAPLWLDARRPTELVGVVLNAPWLDMHGSVLMRTLGTAVVRQLGARRPMRELPRKVTGFYARSLHRDHEGEWDFDLAWKPVESWPVYAGWLRAIRAGHARLQAGLDLPAPVLVLSSASSARPSEMGEDCHRHDIVLDVAQIRRWAVALGSHVTTVQVPDARHDVFLSLPEPRERAYDELDRWTSAYLG